EGHSCASGRRGKSFLNADHARRTDVRLQWHQRPPGTLSEPCPTPVLQHGMQNDILASLARLSDDALATELKTLAARERDAAARMIAHLAEMDTRDIHLRAGHPRLYDYCLSVLHLS